MAYQDARKVDLYTAQLRWGTDDINMLKEYPGWVAAAQASEAAAYFQLSSCLGGSHTYAYCVKVADAARGHGILKEHESNSVLFQQQINVEAGGMPWVGGDFVPGNAQYVTAMYALSSMSLAQGRSQLRTASPEPDQAPPATVAKTNRSRIPEAGYVESLDGPIYEGAAQGRPFAQEARDAIAKGRELKAQGQHDEARPLIVFGEAIQAAQLTTSVLATNRKMYRADGSEWTDHDVVTPTAIIEATAKKNDKMQQVRDNLLPTSNGTAVIVYAPRYNMNAGRDLTAATGVPVTRSMAELQAAIKNTFTSISED